MVERDPFAEYDAAYLFGALSVEDRAAYEAHLSECPECRSGLAGLAGLPGLLAQVPIDQVLDEDSAPAPASLLPRLLTEVARERRRLRLRTAVGGLLAAACLVAAIVFALRGDGNGSRTSGAPAPSPSVAASSSAAGVGLPMRVVTATELRANVAVQSVAWGTRIEMRCTYPDRPEGSGIYRQPSYQLEVVDRDGGNSVVARWNAVAGKTVRIEGDSQLHRSDMSRVQVVNPQGMVVLELTL